MNPARHDLSRYLDQARTCGACDARLTHAGSIVTAPWVRIKCQYGCGGFGERLTCPPYAPTPEQTATILRTYRHAFLL